VRPLRRCAVWTLVAWSLAGPGALAGASPVTVSLIQLIAVPERFDHKMVSVVGYLTFFDEEHSTAGLFLHREDADHGLGFNSIGVEASGDMMRKREKLTGMYVHLVGEFRAVAAAGGGYAILIKDIRECEVWSDPSRPLGFYPQSKRPPGRK
jgi:hypothetical protein